jgi:hypothetical protein
MKAVSLKGRRASLDSIERDMLVATARHVLHDDVDVDALAPITPEQLARALPDRDRREQAIQFLVLMPYLDGEVDPAEVKAVDEFARAVEVEPATLMALHQVRDKRMRRLQFDYFRRSLASGIVSGDSVFGRLRTVFESLHQYRGDAAVAQRYYEYETFPRGSLGRVFYDFYRARGFPIPGEKGSFSELVVPHDLAHILGGFNTDMSGELEVAGMEAGMSKSAFGYELLLEVVLDFHMGLAFTTAGIVDPGVGHFHPDGVLTGFERGAAMNADLLVDWDWHAVMGEQVTDLRERYGILGATVVELPRPTEHDAHPLPAKA